MEVVESISLASKDEWDRLADDIYASHGWLRIIEESFLDPVEHRYFLARADGRLLGTSIAHIHLQSKDAFTLDDSVFGRTKQAASRLGLSLLPSLICGPLRAYGQHLKLDGGLDTETRNTVATALLDAMEKEAESRRIPISFNNVMRHEQDLMDLLKRRRFAWTVNFPLNVLDIHWKTPHEYRSFLAKRNRTREINKNRREGVEISLVDAAEPEDDRLHDLLDENYVKYNGKPLPIKRNFIRLCRQYLGPEARIYTARKNGRIVGTAVLFHRDGVAYVTDVGVDHVATGNDCTYFNLSFYRPVSDAIGLGVQRLYHGTMMYPMKAQRGFQTTDIYLFHRPRNRLLRTLFIPLFAAHRAFKSRFIRRHYF